MLSVVNLKSVTMDVDAAYREGISAYLDACRSKNWCVQNPYDLPIDRWAWSLGWRSAEFDAQKVGAPKRSPFNFTIVDEGLPPGL